MNVETIEGGSARYLSELEQFKDGIPFGVINKTKTDVGGTYCAINCESNYIVVCPFKDLVDSIAADKNNKYNVFKCYGGIREYQFKKYVKDNSTYKIAVTYDSLPKLVKWIGDLDSYKILVDEYHLILEDMDYRYNAINGLMEEIRKFKHYSFLSATPMDCNYEIDLLKAIPHYKVEWSDYMKVNTLRFKATKLTKGLARFIQIFLEEGIQMPDITGEISEVEELYIFMNSVKGIKQIVDSLKLSPELVKICCADRNRNRLLLGEYKAEPVCNPNKRINFFTKKCFQGCNLFTNNGLVIVASDGNKEHTLVDVSTAMEQIAGRIRTNEEYQNIFRNSIVHIFSTNNRILEDAEFTELMEEKEAEASNLLSLQSKATEEELKVLIDKLDIESDIVSVINGRLVYNQLKKQSFIYKQELKKAYKDGLTIRDKFAKSDKFILSDQRNWEDFNIKMSKAITISYEQLLKDYLDNPSSSYELEYPEFLLIRKYLSESEMNTLRWNKDKMLKAVEDKQLIDKVYSAIYKEGFISSKDLKAKFKVEFDKLGIQLAPKASLIEDCSFYTVKQCTRKIEGKSVSGYELGGMRIKF